MELHQLRYFCAIARSGSFTRAAEEESIAQPSLSQQIQKLEIEVGVSAAACFRDRVLTACTRRGAYAQAIFESDQFSSIFPLVASGFGVSINLAKG